MSVPKLVVVGVLVVVVGSSRRCMVVKFCAHTLHAHTYTFNTHMAHALLTKTTAGHAHNTHAHIYTLTHMHTLSQHTPHAHKQWLNGAEAAGSHTQSSLTLKTADCPSKGAV
jgi:hypothetical protein